MPVPDDAGGVSSADAALLDETAEELYENAPCGYLTTRPDGTILKVNGTFLTWTGHDRIELVGRRTFPELLTAGGRMYHETHYAPLLRMQGAVREIALEVVCADGTRLPVLVNSTLRTGSDGKPLLVRTTVFDATDRRGYEQELLSARDRQRNVAQALQQSLLPSEPPRDGRFEVASWYRPAVATLEVGGDWHDAFTIDESRLAISVGDVVGRGLRAATAMGQLRSAVLALAGDGALAPAAMLERLDTFAGRVREARMATLAYAEIDLDTRLMRYARAGHPPIVLTQPGTPPELLWDGGSTPLGVFGGRSRRSEAEVALEPGARVLLFTDGLVERRDRSLDACFDELLGVVDARRDLPLGQFVEEVQAEMLADTPGDDDVCLLALELIR